MSEYIPCNDAEYPDITELPRTNDSFRYQVKWYGITKEVTVSSAKVGAELEAERSYQCVQAMKQIQTEVAR